MHAALQHLFPACRGQFHILVHFDNLSDLLQYLLHRRIHIIPNINTKWTVTDSPHPYDHQLFSFITLPKRRSSIPQHKHAATINVDHRIVSLKRLLHIFPFTSQRIAGFPGNFDGSCSGFGSATDATE